MRNLFSFNVKRIEEFHIFDLNAGAAVFEGCGIHGADAILRMHGICIAGCRYTLEPRILEAADRRGLNQLARFGNAALILRALHGVLLRKGHKVAFDVSNVVAVFHGIGINEAILVGHGIIAEQKMRSVMEIPGLLACRRVSLSKIGGVQNRDIPGRLTD